MQVGCGLRVREIKGHPYVYFWHYEDRYGRSSQVFTYLGPARSLATTRRASEAIDAHYARAADALRNDLAAHRAQVAALRGSGRPPTA